MERGFLDILADLDEGAVADEASRQLQEVVRAARRSKKKASLTVKIDITPDGERQFIVDATVTPKIPAPTPGMTMFFATDNGQLRKDDPKQIPLKNLEQPTGGRTLREVPFDTAGKGA